MMSNDSISAEVIEITEIEIPAPEGTGPWRDFDRFSPTNWRVQVFQRKKKSSSSTNIFSIHYGQIVNISLTGLACKLDIDDEIKLGDRFKVRLEIRGKSIANKQYQALAEVVRSCKEDICFSRFIDMPNDLASIITKELRLNTNLI